jgi:hypothetical protein
MIYPLSAATAPPSRWVPFGNSLKQIWFELEKKTQFTIPNCQFWKVGTDSNKLKANFYGLSVGAESFRLLTLYPLAILSTCYFLNVPFRQFANLSTCLYYKLPFHLLSISPACHFIYFPFHQHALPFSQFAILPTRHFVDHLRERRNILFLT